MTRTPALRPALVAAALALAACAATPRATLHALEPVAAGGGATIASLPEATIAIDPITLAESVDRPQFVVALPGAGLTILEQQRWAEPLREAIPRVVAAGLARALGGARVSAYPAEPPPGVRYRVALDIRRFDSRPGEGVTIAAGWTVRAAGAGLAGEAALTETARGAGYDALAAAHARALDGLGREIARTVAALAAAPR